MPVFTLPTSVIRVRDETTCLSCGMASILLPTGAQRKIMSHSEKRGSEADAQISRITPALRASSDVLLVRVYAMIRASGYFK